MKYHPDKCKLPDANARFIEIREAYLVLLHANHTSASGEGEDGLSYGAIFASFVKTVVKVWKEPDKETHLYHLILVKVVGVCEHQALEYLRKIDRSKLAKVLALAKMHADVFGFSAEFVDELERMVSGANANANDDDVSADINRIFLNPLLEDLLADNLYRLNWKGESLIVPMWHHETSFDVYSGTLDVVCSPVLPPNVELDEDNTLVVTAEYYASSLLGQIETTIEVGQKRLSVSVSELRMVREQWVVFEGQGVAAMNVDDVYDVLVRRPIKVRVLLL